MPEKSSYEVLGYDTNIVLEKKTPGFWKGVTKKDKNVRNLSVDWNNYVDPEEEEEEKKPDPMGGMGMPGMGMPGGMGGMPGMGGPGGMDPA